MFSYLHKYHAGNFADVHKHLTLISIVNKLKEKSKPFSVLDAHAGEGIYDLTCNAAKLNKEHKQGINRLFGNGPLPKNIKEYVSLILKYNDEAIDKPTCYPGSPALIESLLRKDDKAHLVEGHPKSFQVLKSHFRRSKQCHLHERDSSEAMLALLPFKEKRGLVLVDPSYEVKSEYCTIVDAVYKAYQKMPNAIFAIWYPILKQDHHRKLIQAVKNAGFKSAWLSEWRPYSSDSDHGLMGSGMIVINKPWKIEDGLTGTFIELNKRLYKDGRWYQKTLIEAP